jgi:Rod binding domain-containing protein
MLENGINQAAGTSGRRTSDISQATNLKKPAYTMPAVSSESFRQNLDEELNIASDTKSPATHFAKANSISAEQLQEIEKVSRDLESMLLNMMLKEMWKSVPESELFGNEMATKFYREMWLEKIAETIAVEGSGLGVADVIKKELVTREERSISLAELLAYERQLTGIEAQNTLDNTPTE